MFKCEYCGREFKSINNLTSHKKHYCKNNPNTVQVIYKAKYTEHKKECCQFCGKLFDVANLARHEKACGDPNSKLNLKKVKDTYHASIGDLNCIFCAKLCKNKNSLAQHELRCPKNPDRKAFTQLLNENGESPRKGKNKYNDPTVAKCAKSLKESYESGKCKSPTKGKPGKFAGKHHTAEVCEKIRQSTLKYIATTTGGVKPCYNKEACIFIDSINSKLNINLQHAENGGEISINGYFPDGYDKVNNIVFEYDEPLHYIDVTNSILRDKDIIRMKFIIEKTNCRFIRYNEKINLLYEIDSDLNIKIIDL